MKEKDTKHSRKYLIDLVERHSVVALIAGIMVFDIPVEKLINAYIFGALDSMKEKK